MTAVRARAEPKTTPALLGRQRQLLRLLDALGGSVGKLDFQKLLFLYCQEPSSGAPYDFVPYNFGAFSFTSYADRRKLIDRGLLADDEHRWTLTDEGRSVVGLNGDMLVSDFARRCRSLRGDELVADTYRRFPFFATRSEIAEKVLEADRATLARIVSLRASPGGSPLHTIGYEGHTLEGYLNLLLECGISLLCDVRRNPISRKYGFSKTTLARACDGLGIRYEHLPELGIASEQRRGLTTQADYDALFAEYVRSSLPQQTEALNRVRGWIHAGERVALTCYERLPHQCHRHCVADALTTGVGKGLSAKHL
jgi:hypothetical protein